MSRPSPLRSASAGEVRLIGGRWKRSKLVVLPRAGLRPTPDRVRETLFNWLGQDLAGWHVLDAYAGSGALGFEAASRGAARVCLVEQDATLVAQLHAARQRLSAEAVQVVRADALQWLGQTSDADFDLILLDPPFGHDLFEASLAGAVRLLRSRGFVYLEADRPFDDAALRPHGLRLWRSGRAGAVHFHLLVHAEPPVAVGAVAED